MGEQASKIGKKLEGFGETLFSDLGWTELARDKEIKCNRASHKKKTHGIDLLFKYSNPYSNGAQGVIVECKNRQMRSISKCKIEEWVKELISNLECAQSAQELSDVHLEGASLNTGLLLIHANDTFDQEAFYKYLSGMQFANRRNPINVFIAGNDKIDEWTSLLSKAKSYGETFNFLYPSINGYSKVTQPAITISLLYSRYILAQSAYFTTESNGLATYEKPHSQSILFFLDEINIDNFKYAWSMFKHFQMQGTEKYCFVFYPRKTGDVDYVKENFVSTLKNAENPITVTEANKISIEFLTNRTLSPIETGGNE